MKNRQPSRRSMLECCAQLHVDDGISPRHQNRTKPKYKQHSSARFCSQVQQALRLAIGEHCLDTPLSQWDVDSVEQENGCPTLIVKLVCVVDNANTDEDIHMLLNQYRDVFRQAVAQAISRKKTPALRFQLLSVATTGRRL